MRLVVKTALWLGAILALTTAFAASAGAQNEDREKPPAKPGGQAGAAQGQGGMGQMT